jgi:hypothetical protein
MANENRNASVVKAIRSGSVAKPGQHCVCWNDEWDNSFVLGTVLNRITVEHESHTEQVFKVQSGLTGSIFTCDYAVVYDGVMPVPYEEETDKSTAG